MVGAWMFVGAALAGDAPNWEASLRVGIVVAPGRPHPVGVELGGNLRFALLDSCGYAESDCYDGVVWPTAGPSVIATWRGGPRWGGFAGVVGGIGTADMHHFGFFPLWALDLRVGWAGEIGEGGGLAGGLEVGRALGAIVTSGNTSRTYGFVPASLRVGVRSGWTPDAGLSPARWDVALELSPIAGDLE